MDITEPTVKALQKVVTGDPLPEGSGIAPYRSGPELVHFFNQFGADDVYGQGFPSRWHYAEESIRRFNSTNELKEIVEAAVDPRHFLGTDADVGEAVEFLNKFLEYDGFVLSLVGRQYQLVGLQTDSVNVGGLFSDGSSINQRFITEQLAKCDRKLTSNDYTGAITNSRSLVEAVLREIEAELYDDPPRYDGNLSSLYKRVYRAMNLDPGQEGLSNAAREILSGLISAISGLAPLRNAASDAHALEYEPRAHHAALAVNSAKTIVRFLVDSLQHQFDSGLLHSPDQ